MMPHRPLPRRFPQVLAVMAVVSCLAACDTDQPQSTAGEDAAGPGSSELAQPPLRATPGWSLETAEIAFQSGAEGDLELFLARGRQASGWERLTSSPGVDAAAGWAPSGTWLTFESERIAGPGSGELDVWVLPLPATDSSEAPTDGPGWPGPMLIATGAADGDAPAVSPDGRRVAFYSKRSEASVPDGAAGHLWLADLPVDSTSLGRVTRITREPIPTGDGSSWHPSGEDLFVTRGRGAAGPRDLVMVSADGTRERTLVANGRVNRDPRPSPDGDFLAFTSEGGDTTQVMIARIDGSGARPLAVGPFRVTGWTPDQAWIVADRTDGERTDVYLIPVAGSGGPEPLFDGAQPTAAAAFRPVPTSGMATSND